MIEEFIKDLKKSLRALKATISEIRKDPGYDKIESFFIEDYEGNFRQHLKEFAFLVKKISYRKNTTGYADSRFYGFRKKPLHSLAVRVFLF